MIVKDWMAEAALEIDNEPYEDAYAGVDIKRDIIAKHCPFLSDTAYMRVPRCETCAHWKPRPDDHYVEVEQTGECTSKLGPWSDCGDYTILTGNDFGCVEWKEKV